MLPIGTFRSVVRRDRVGSDGLEPKWRFFLHPRLKQFVGHELGRPGLGGPKRWLPHDTSGLSPLYRVVRRLAFTVEVRTRARLCGADGSTVVVHCSEPWSRFGEQRE
jgi:hypothetical protein